MRRRIGSLALAALLLAACTRDTGHPVSAGGSTGSGPTTPSSSPTPSSSTGASSSAVLPAETLTCGNAIDGLAPPADWTVVLGVVALPASPASRALQASDSGNPTIPLLFAKTGLLIRTGVAFQLSVPAVTGNELGIGWSGAPSSPGRRFAVPACPDQYGTGWLSYPGGYWADRPLCLPLTVRAGTREQQVQIGIGTPCPGQEPPAS
jgi:hypothetical protein